ncbi:MAG: hypothetical protein AB7P00_35575 [Sandaracinaceae bacterium]
MPRRAIALAIVLAGCGGSAPPPRPPRPMPSVGPLRTLLPTDAHLVVSAAPRALMTEPATRRVVEAVFDQAQMDRYRARTGVDPRELDELAIAADGDGTVIVARGVADAAFAVREAGERMAPLEASVERPFVRRAGFIGARRADLAALDPRTVAWIDGTPQLAQRTLDAARRPAARRPRARSDLASLREAIGDAPFALFAQRPLELPLDTGIGMLMAQERALAIGVRPAEDGESLRIVAILLGEFPPDAHENFRAFAESIAASDLGAALGAADALSSLTIATDDDGVRAEVRIDAGVLAVGLRTVLSAELRELIDGPDET